MTTSIGSILSKARTAMSANQTAIDVVSHNVANAATPGYSRQRAEMVAAMPMVTPNGVIGRGVEIDNIAQLRDSILDVTYRNETSGSWSYQRRGTLLGQVESLHSDLGTPGLSSALDQFWTSWSDLANDPTNASARTLLRASAEDVIASFARLTDGPDQITATAAQRLRDDLGQVNQLSSHIASLNESIVQAEAGGVTAGDLRDARDLAIDQLSQFGNVQVVERSNGGVGVSINGVNVVDGDLATPLVLDTTGGVYGVAYGSGRNEIAQQLVQLRETPNAALGNLSIGGAYAASVSRVGSAVRAAVDNEAVHTTVAASADTARSSVSGVNIDEEMVNLIRFQNAFRRQPDWSARPTRCCRPFST